MNRATTTKAPGSIIVAAIAFGITAIAPTLYPVHAISELGDRQYELPPAQTSVPPSDTNLLIDRRSWASWTNQQSTAINFALISNNSNQLDDGDHIFSSRLPDPNQHPDIHLAGAEIYAFSKNGNQVIGERFIANSGNTACFRGKISGKVIIANSIITGYMETPSQKDLISIQIDLTNFFIITRQDNAYAQGSVQRCRQLFQQLDN